MTEDGALSFKTTVIFIIAHMFLKWSYKAVSSAHSCWNVKFLKCYFDLSVSWKTIVEVVFDEHRLWRTVIFVWIEIVCALNVKSIVAEL